jgi:outer membrane protein TolC
MPGSSAMDGMKMVEETRAMDELRSKVLADIASLRQNEADLDASEARLKFYESKSEWLQKRVKNGFSDSVELWGIGQKLHEERVTAERLRVLAASARYQMASYAGVQWKVLLGCLEGKGELEPRH